MATKKVIAICQWGGNFVTDKDGMMSYNGGEASAIDIDEQTTMDDLKAEVAETISHSVDNMLIKYFLPGNKKTLINIAKDKDLKRMISFLGETPTVDMYIMTQEDTAPNVSGMPCSRETVSEAEVPVDCMMNEIVEMEILNDATPLNYCPGSPSEESQRKAAQQWENIITGVGQRFNSVNEFRDALHKYSIARSFAYRYKKNDNDRVSAKCKSQGCPWYIYASKLSKTKFICIKKMEALHTCEGIDGFKAGYRATKGWVGNIIKEKLKVNPSYKPKDIVADIEREYGIQLHYSQARRAREVAREQLQGSHIEAYSQIPFLCEKIEETNPGSVATFVTKDDSSFHRLFVSFGASISGFEQGCRPLLFLDAITFVSGTQNGLKKALVEEFDNSCYHSHCVRHLAEKISIQLKGQLSFDARKFLINDIYAAAQAPKLEGFQQSIENIKGMCPDAYNWVLQSEPEHWASVFFTGARYNHIVSDFGQDFYGWVSDANDLPITQMMDKLRVRMMESIYIRRAEADQWVTKLTPSNEEKLQKEILGAQSLGLEVSAVQDHIFEVCGETVSLENWDCSCKVWRLTGLPCRHAIAVFELTGRSPYDYCAQYFTSENYRLAYAESIHPVPNVESRIKTENEVVVNPPATRGRRSKAESTELFKRQLQCSKCKGLGHNKLTCKES
ncbi:hypothetical protein ACFE04_005725 [Oxalis oulophora]